MPNKKKEREKTQISIIRNGSGDITTNFTEIEIKLYTTVYNKWDNLGDVDIFIEKN